ncbi:MAG: helix-turn-helix domain-containing protein [Actinomycetota bacterium]|nr:helix-turn-helix domain-containing protein [Actinomycetota bacterium]
MTVEHPLVESLKPVAEALGADIVPPDHIEDGDIPLRWDGVVVAGFRSPGLHNVLDRLLDQLEREAGQPLGDLDREAKQDAVRRLDEQGAFVLRRAVEDVADRLGVSRFTVYNYLNARSGEL